MSFEENGLYIALDVSDDGDVRLLHFAAVPFDPALVDGERQAQWFRLVEVQATGEDVDDHHGLKHTGSVPGKRLRFVAAYDAQTAAGRLHEIELFDPALSLRVIVHWQFYDGVPVMRAWTSITNEGSAPVGLEYVSSFALAGLAKEGAGDWDEKTRLHVCHNAWEGEVQWRANSLPELGLSHVHGFSLKRLAYSNSSPWSTSQFVPTACLENTAANTALIWQIESSSAWHWEISDIRDQLYLHLSGPTEAETQWWKNLAPGATFTSVPVAVGAVQGAFGDAVRAMTQYRRKSFLRDNRAKLPIVFNDYMNCLFGDPTTAKELPLIEIAAQLGCEIFVIDAGWYADDGTWWDQVGDWLPSQKRFPGSFRSLVAAIREKGMIPGIWLEIEVIGVNNARAKTLPDDWFFCRHGKRVIDHGRYQLDFRNPDVLRFADGVVDRLIGEYGFGYVKLDYNINAGAGTELNADSFGDGLLEHTRAYVGWIDGLQARYPNLWIENCASGGMRMDYGLLNRLAIQSVSDQVDYRKVAVIAASAPSAVLPEQAASWSYPMANDDAEAVIFNMVNALLLRVQQSGGVADLPPERLALVRAGLDVYKTIRADIPNSLPYWPLGLPNFGSGWTSLALRSAGKTYLAVWRLGSPDAAVDLPLPFAEGAARCLYPPEPACSWVWDGAAHALRVTLPQPFSARVFELS